MKRISILLAFGTFAWGCNPGENSTASSKEASASSTAFVKVKGAGFEIGGKPYYFMGTNYWYGANLGSEGKGGDRERLVRELDELQKLGVTNLRILGLSEGPDDQPFRIAPAVQKAPGRFDEEVLKGLDFLLAEMGKRNMYAVIVLGNFWPWSGGFGQYLVWSGAADSIPYPPPHPGGSWDTYQKFTARFYSDEKAVRMYREAVRKIVTRTNSITGKAYSEDPAIMSWQLANEPRGMNNTEDFNKWIDSTAALIKSLDKNHLVTAGTEGYTSAREYSGTDIFQNHDGENIDYTTAHIWIENWGWYDPKNHGATYDSAVIKMKDYMREHAEGAKKLGKPLVVEEFGIARDSGNFDPVSPATRRDDYYAQVFEEAYNYGKSGAPVSGVNFWAWGGEGRPREPMVIWKAGDNFIGDPPHEFQGWYSVYDTDTSTHKIISSYAEKMNSLK